jgi:hypothetical protein
VAIDGASIQAAGWMGIRHRCLQDLVGFVRLGGVWEGQLKGWDEGRDELIPWQARRHHPARARPTHFPFPLHRSGVTTLSNVDDFA